MKSKFAQRLLLSLPALLGVIMLLTPYVFAPVCDKLIELKSGAMGFMKCHYTGQAELVLGALLLCVGLMLFLPKIEKRWLGAVVALIGLATILVPQAWVIGICAKDTMSCHTTIWWLYVEGFLTMAFGLAIWSGLIKDGAE